jgi:hypothetical protein
MVAEIDGSLGGGAAGLQLAIGRLSATTWLGEGRWRTREGRGVDWREKIVAEGSPFIGSRGGRGARGRSTAGSPFQSDEGASEGRRVLATSRRCWRASWRGQRWCSRVVLFGAVWQYGGGSSSSVTTATVRARAGERVWEIEGTVATRLVPGESEGRREATGHSGVLSRPGLPACASWRAWTFSGRVWASCSWPLWCMNRPGLVSIRRRGVWGTPGTCWCMLERARDQGGMVSSCHGRHGCNGSSWVISSGWQVMERVR